MSTLFVVLCSSIWAENLL